MVPAAFGLGSATCACLLPLSAAHHEQVQRALENLGLCAVPAAAQQRRLKLAARVRCPSYYFLKYLQPGFHVSAFSPVA